MRILQPLTALALGLCLFVQTGNAQKRKSNTTQATTSTYDTTLYNAMEFRNIGPFRGGRATAVAGVVQDPMTYYMGATGGVWKTDDAGESWKNVSDGFMNTASVGAITVSESDPNVVYVGMGEAPVRGVMTSHGDGMYKSTDGGKTWKHIGLEKTRQISKIAVHPDNSDVVIVAAQGSPYGATQDRGIYKTTDGGKTWNKVHYVDENSGVSDLSMDMTNPRIIYAAYWDHRRFPWKVQSGGPGSGLYKSVDGGDTWEKMSKGLPKRSEDYSLWYNELVKKADLAENSAVRGCMVIKPYGFSIWEKMQAELDRMFKETGHSNAYFPLFIPKSYLSKEADHVEGFAKECAVVTHYRLMKDPNGNGVVVDPDAKLEEELIVRPTSETVIWSTYKNWVQSYRDLPLLINQWANVVRWEMRTRLFLRTAEFLWQEGHTAHATKQEAIDESVQMMNVYAHFAEEFMAMPVVRGIKSASERFAGALETYCIEAMMQDGKALQAGTSHFLGQNFAKAFEVKFTSKEGIQEYVWGTSWGVSTRLIGALIMAHSDDQGLVLPPKLAPIQVVIVPIYKGEEQLQVISEKVAELTKGLRKKGISVKFDDRDTYKPGFKFAEWELKGIPVRLAIGPKDLENNSIEIARRDTGEKELFSLEDSLADKIVALLEDIQTSIYKKAFDFRAEKTTSVDTYEEFKQVLDDKAGFVSAHWDGTTETEEKIKEETKATIRCIPLDQVAEEGKCVYSGKPSKGRVLFARAY